MCYLTAQIDALVLVVIKRLITDIIKEWENNVIEM